MKAEKKEQKHNVKIATSSTPLNQIDKLSNAPKQNQ